MKNKVALLMIFIFTLSLLSPTILAWDRDWNSPRYSTDATNSSSTTEGHPWGELEASTDNGYDNYFEVNSIVESVFSYIKYMLFSAEYVPPTIIIIQQNDLSDDSGNDNESKNTRQENENTNKRIPFSG